MPFKVALYEPEIPPNTGNIMRLCANTGCELHLLEPLGFSLDERRLKRAGLDYADWGRVSTHSGWETFSEGIDLSRCWAFTTKGSRLISAAEFAANDTLLFGPETRGLPDDVLAALPAEQRVRLPMRANSRSLNLSNAVAIAVYEGWRQLGFPQGA